MDGGVATEIHRDSRRDYASGPVPVFGSSFGTELAEVAVLCEHVLPDNQCPGYECARVGNPTFRVVVSRGIEPFDSPSDVSRLPRNKEWIDTAGHYLTFR